MKAHGAVVVREHAVSHQRVQMDVEIQRPTEALDDPRGAAAPIGDAGTVRAAPEEPEYGSDSHPADRATQVVIPGQQVPQPVRQTHDPLADRHVGKDVIDEMRGPLRHPSAPAARAEPAALTREGDASIQPAGRAPKAGEAAG